MKAVVGRVGPWAMTILEHLRGFLRANLLVWLGILVVLFVYYFVLDRQGL